MNPTPVVIAAMIDHQNSHFTHGSAFRPHIHSFHRKAYIAIEMKVTGIILDEILKSGIKNGKIVHPSIVTIAPPPNQDSGVLNLGTIISEINQETPPTEISEMHQDIDLI